ncbi:uncharacterized protein PV07_12822, partial [Cladophialophora immunda]
QSVEKVAARLDHKDWHVRQAALTVLQRQSSLPDKVLLNPRCFKSLHKSWLQLSFTEQVYGSITKNDFSLNTPKGVQATHFNSEDKLGLFRGVITEVQLSLCIPEK